MDCCAWAVFVKIGETSNKLTGPGRGGGKRERERERERERKRERERERERERDVVCMRVPACVCARAHV